MDKIMKRQVIVCIMMLVALSGCQTTQGNAGKVNAHYAVSDEAQWIRQGEPLEFEGQLWYPVDGVEGFLDSEMLLLGEYRGVSFFVDKVDIRPFGRLYTKFDNNKFRFFEQRINK